MPQDDVYTKGYEDGKLTTGKTQLFFLCLHYKTGVLFDAQLRVIWLSQEYHTSQACSSCAVSAYGMCATVTHLHKDVMIHK